MSMWLSAGVRVRERNQLALKCPQKPGNDETPLARSPVNALFRMKRAAFSATQPDRAV
jgi:hypothetical protein